MNHCLLEVKVQRAPTIRYTQDNKTPIAEMEVSFDGLRAEDPQGRIKVVGWGNMAQELQTKVSIEETIIIEGRLRMNTVPRQDGTKEKRAEFTLSKLHPIAKKEERKENASTSFSSQQQAQSNSSQTTKMESNSKEMNWDSSPLVPDTDEIPF